MIWTFIICVTLWHSSWAIPFSSQNADGATTVDALNFLHDYGYLSPSASDSTQFDASALRPVSPEVVEAIQNFQTNYGLEVTGRLDGSTRHLMSQPRCGNKDITDHSSVSSKNPLIVRRVKRYTYDGITKWNRINYNLTYNIISYPTSGLTASKVHNILRHAFNTWAEVARLDFIEVPRSRKADIEILFGKRRHGDAIPFDGPSRVLGHAYFPSPYEQRGEYTRNGDVHFDDDEKWVEGVLEDGTNLLSVAVHEIGHALGLAHSMIKTAIMYPFYNLPEGSLEVKLGQDDIDGIREIYGASRPNKILPKVIPLPRETLPPSVVSTEPPGGWTAPRVCETSIDAIINMRDRELFIFKDAFSWRISWSTLINEWHSYQLKMYPHRYDEFWMPLQQAGIREGIDAGFEDKKTNYVYFFRGQRFWVLHDNQRFVNGCPREGMPLQYLGLPANLTKVNAMFQWHFNQQIYIFAGDKYWKFNNQQVPFGYVESQGGYPRQIGVVWRGVPNDIDAAHTDISGVTYFLKGRQIYPFNNIQMRVFNGYPREARVPWLGCFDSSAEIIIDEQQIGLDAQNVFGTAGLAPCRSSLLLTILWSLGLAWFMVSQ